jgi:hypothetical protein
MYPEEVRVLLYVVRPDVADVPCWGKVSPAPPQQKKSLCDKDRLTGF